MRPLWELSISYTADERYIVTDAHGALEADSESDACADPEPRYSFEPWYADSPHKFCIQSEELLLRDVQPDIELLVSTFGATQRRMSRLATWQDQGLDVAIRCQCGHLSVKSAKAFMEQRGRIQDVFSLAPNLRCSRCAKSGAATLVPCYRPTNVSRALPEPADNEGGSLRELYEVLGGDGVQNVYVSDGIYLTPAGADIDEGDK